jgi:fructokinase
MLNNLRLGLDIGGTKIEAVLLDDSGNTLQRERVPTGREDGYSAVLSRIVNLCKDVCQKQKITSSQLASIGIGLPGTVDPKSKQMLNGNTALFVGRDFAADFARELNLSSLPRIANDANCFALAEALHGAGKTYSQTQGISPDQLIVVGIILGTGVGGGLVINGKIVEGARGAAAEIGHTQLDPQGRLCFCGRIGCSETILSGTGIEADYSSQFGRHKKSKDIFADPADHSFVLQYRKKLEQFLLNVANTFDPHVIVLGGGVSNQDSIYRDLDLVLNQQFFLKNQAPKVMKNQLGDSAGVFGAALL